MPTLALTPANRKILKWLIDHAGDIAGPGLLYLLTLLDAHESSPAPLYWTRWHIRFNRVTPSGIPEDKGEFKLDILNLTADEVDVTWTSTDLTTVNNAINTMLTSLQPYCDTSQSFVETAVYGMSFNDAMDPKKPFTATGPPLALYSYVKAGSGTGIQAYQVAGSVTFKTAFPRHWGRVYLPTPPNSLLTTSGRLDGVYRPAVAGAFRTCFTTLQDAGFWPVIPMTKAGGAPAHGLLGVIKIQVDDVPDVQRRRRSKQTAARTIV